MNEKIRALAEQSGFFPVPDETEWDWEYRAENARYEKFAELIVKECVRVCEDDLLDEYMRKCFAAQEEGILYAAVADCCSAMKQHFGIEE